MKKILIVGHPLYHYLESIADGFRENGCESLIFSHKNTNVLKLDRSNIFKRWRSRWEINRINQTLIDTFSKFKPDLVLVINGETLLPKTVDLMNLTSVTSLWLVDGFNNIKLPKTTMMKFHKRFIFEPTDVSFLPDADYLPYGCDPQIYKPETSPVFSRDLAFVGAGHEDRLPLLNNLAIFCREQNINFEIFGPFNKKHTKAFPALFNAIKLNDKVAPSQVAEIYRSSRINLNIHHSQSREGINPRVFEIAGCGAFQLCDKKLFLDRLFPDISPVCYTDFESLKTAITTFLDDENQRCTQASELATFIKNEHTFQDRCRKILESIG